LIPVVPLDIAQFFFEVASSQTTPYLLASVCKWNRRTNN